MTAETGGDDDYYHEFDPPDPLRISAGDLAGSTRIIVYTDDDDVDTFRVSLGTIEGGAAAGSPSSVLVTIEDNDAGGGAVGSGGNRDLFATWDRNRNGKLTCSEASGLRLPAYSTRGTFRDTRGTSRIVCTPRP